MPAKRLFTALAAVAIAAVAFVPQAGASFVDVRTLKGPAPSWYTAELRARVLAAGSAGVALPANARVPASSLAFLGIRPGQLLLIGDGTLCTSNFVFGGQRTTARNGKAVVRVGGRKGSSSPSSYAIGTAGHCGKVGEEVVMLYAPKGLVRIGQIVKSTGDPQGDKLAPDFALIAIDPALNADVSPSMAHWGGPTGIYTGDDVVPINHSGWGLVAGTGGTPRAGVAYQWGTEYRFEGVVTPGDSGSAANVVGGLAAGNITHIAVDTREQVPVWNGGTSIQTILQIAGLPLAVCSVAIPWPLPGCPPV